MVAAIDGRTGTSPWRWSIAASLARSHRREEGDRFWDGDRDDSDARDFCRAALTVASSLRALAACRAASSSWIKESLLLRWCSRTLAHLEARRADGGGDSFANP